ncbi:hypothetical protein CRG98_041327 [Punica granatum]|nr:hypothetical protein CRG98_041327 [Punica granatum]
MIPVHCKSSNNFQITIEAMEAAYEKAQQGPNPSNIKGLIITNPSNPLGTTLDRETLKGLVRFVCEKNIHLVCDEIYSATVFKPPHLVSVSEVMEEVGGCNRDLIHVVYSLSKDMGLPGLRVGIIYSYNDAVVSCARKMSSFGLVSSQTQHLLASMLSDEEFIGQFIRESSKRLAKRHTLFTKGLAQMGISCLDSNAGLFFWMDLRPLLKEQTFEAEMQLWRVIINDVKLNVSPGSSFCCTEPGFFRVCFADMDDHTVEVALNRIRAFVLREEQCVHNKNQAGTTLKKRRNWQNNVNLRLSFSSRGYDESIQSPHKMSPHSPIPQSPLVQAKT